MGDMPSSLEMLIRAVLAMLGAGTLGLERERYGKPAGLRTQMMVGLGAAIFTMISLRLYIASLQTASSGEVDLLRTVGGIIGGIGFLGAGTIIQARGSVTGITTASTIWVVGAFGIACGLGHYFLAGVALGCALTILVIFGRVEKYLLVRTPKQDEPPDRAGNAP